VASASQQFPCFANTLLSLLLLLSLSAAVWVGGLDWSGGVVGWRRGLAVWSGGVVWRCGFDNHHQQPLTTTTTKHHYQQLLPTTTTNIHYQQPLPKTTTNNHYKPLPNHEQAAFYDYYYYYYGHLCLFALRTSFFGCNCTNKMESAHTCT
jgi:hypothetical protein